MAAQKGKKGSAKLPKGNTGRTHAPYFALEFRAEDGTPATAFRHAASMAEAREKAEDILASIADGTTPTGASADQLPDGIPGDWGLGQAGKATITRITQLTSEGSLTKQQLRSLGKGSA